MADTLASLVVALEVQSAELRKGLDAATARLDSFAKKADSLGKIISGALSFEVAKDAISALSRFVLKGAETADQMGKLAQASGVSVEQFSRLNYAADLAGVSSEQLGSALGRLSKQMTEALAGGKDQAAVFKALGVSVTDASGRLRTAQDVMGDVAERFAGLEDGAAKSALAQELFGKSGADLIPLLNAGRDGLAAMGVEADRFGLTVTAKGAAASGQFNDALRRLEMAGQGVAMRAAQDLAPSLAALGDELLATAGKSNALVGAAEALAGAFRVLVSGGAIVAGVFEAVGKSVGALAAAGAEISMGQYKEALETMKLLGGDLANTAKSTADRIGAIWERQSSAVEKHADKTKTAADGIIKQMGRLKVAQVDVGSEPNKGLFGGLGESAAKTLGLGMAGPMGGGVLIEAENKTAVAVRKAMEAREKAEREFNDAVARAEEDRTNALIQSAIGSVQSKSGNMGSIISGAAEGGAVGGPLGALGGALFNILEKSTAFASLIETLDQIFSAFSEGLGSLIEPMLPLLQISLMLDEALVKLLEPFAAIAEKAAPLLFDGLKLAALGIVGLTIGVGAFQNAVLDFIASMYRTIASIEVFGKRPFGALDDAANQLEDLKFDTGGLIKAFDEISGLTYDQARAQRELTKATDQATASMLNVPSGWKINLARFNATNPDLGRQFPGGATIGGSSTPAPTGGAPGGSSPGAPGAAPVVNVILDGQMLAQALRIEIRKGDARTRGNPAGLAPAYAGG